MKPSVNLVIDIIAALIYILAANPLITGWVIHEWVSIGLIFIFVVHCAMHYDWIVTAIKKRVSAGAYANLALDIATLVVFMLAIVSGLMVSRVILPFIGFVAPGFFFWEPLHEISAKILFALTLVHVVVHGRWIASLLSGRKKEQQIQEKEERS